MKVKETIAQIVHNYQTDQSEEFKNQYREKFFFMPIKNGDGRIELLYPTPFLTEEQAEKLHVQYYEKYQEIINKIENL